MNARLRTHRLLASTSLALTLALAAGACSNDDTSTVAVGDGGGDSAIEAPVAIRVASGSGGGASVAEFAAAPAAGDLSADTAMIAPWYVAEYVVGADLPDLGTEATGWRYAPNPAFDQDAFRRVGEAFGVTGDIVEIPVDLGGGFRIGPDDGTAPSLWVGADSQLSWWYSPAFAFVEGSGTVSTGVACAEPILIDPLPVEILPADETTTAETPEASDAGAPRSDDVPAECVYVEPEPPTGILTEPEAEGRALELWSSIGVDTSNLELDSYADEWSASVSGYPLLGGVRAPLSLNIGFGAEGRVEWAGGVLAQPVEVGPYPLIGVDEAVERLRSGYGGWGGPMPLTTDAAVDSRGVADVATDAGAPAVGAPEIDPAACAADGPDCFPTAEPITVTLVDARLALWSLWDTDGTMWFVPAYTFIADDGGEYTVPAVTDEYLVVDEAVSPEDPTDPGTEPGTEPGGTGGGEPGVVPGDEGTGETVPATGDDPVVELPDPVSDAAAALLTLTEEEAGRLAASNGWSVRIVARDGESFAVTEDYSPTRVNLSIEGGVVVDVTVG